MAARGPQAELRHEIPRKVPPPCPTGDVARPANVDVVCAKQDDSVTPGGASGVLPSDSRTEATR
jgi:hypothetical protein